METLEIKVIELSNGFLVEDPDRYGSNICREFEFNGDKPAGTFHSRWYLVKSLKNVVKIIPEKKTPVKLKLKSNVIETDEYPAEVPYSYESDYYGSGFYETVYDVEPSKKVEIELKANILYKIKDIESLKGFSFKVKDPRWPNSQPSYHITQDKAIHQIIDQIIFPKPMLATRPTRLSSIDSYEIIRNYIKDNINPKYAEITSDYDFCFTVQKKIPLSQKQEYKYDANFTIFGKRKKPKHLTAYHTDRKVKVFEIAPERDGKVYNGYSRCKEFEGENYQDLVNNIQTYLKNLIEEINHPLVDCPKCSGSGVINTKNK